MPPARRGSAPKGGQAKVFGLTTTGTQDSARVLDSIGGRGADARPAWGAVHQLLRADEVKRFDTKGYGYWPNLKASTLAAKQAKGLDSRIMRATGALHRSLTVERGKGAIRGKSKTVMRFGSRLYYSRFHQEGQGVPKRVLTDVDRALQRQIVAILESHVAKGEIPERLQNRV